VLESDPEIVLHVSAGRSITGTVEDEFTGEVVPGAQLKISALDLPAEIAEIMTRFPEMLEQTTLADAHGYFEVLGINPGSYQFEVRATGFSVKLSEAVLSPDLDLDVGRIGLERLSALTVQLIGIGAGASPQLSVGVTGERVAVNEDGIGVVHVSPYYIPLHFSVWLNGPPMMNIYCDKELGDVEIMPVTVGGASVLEVSALGSLPRNLQDGVIPFVKIRYVSKYGHRAEWSHELREVQTVVCDTIDADRVSIDLVAARDTWPDVLANIVVPIEAGRINTATIAFPREARRVVLRALNGEPLDAGIVTEIRRPHDSSQWLAANRTDSRGSVPWPQVEDPHLYASGFFSRDEVESYFVDVQVPTGVSGGGDLVVDLGESIPQRIRVMVGEEAWSGAWVVVLGRHTDQEWSDFLSSADGYLPAFDVSRESRVDLLIEDSRVREHGQRVPLVSADQVIQLTRK